MSLPSQSGKHVVITGANTGIGRVTALELAKAGASLVLAGRSLERTQPVLDELRALGAAAEFVALDLGDLNSVRSAAAAISEMGRPIHTLINNAGLAGRRGQTTDGFEVQFGVNHVGPFLLTQLLLPQIRGVEGARIVNVASRAHTRVKTFNWDIVVGDTQSKTGFPEYCNSKLANVLFSAELAKREGKHGVNVYSLHPGVVATDIWRSFPGFMERFIKLFMITVDEGAATTIHCATSVQAAEQTGLYYDKCRPIETSKAGKDSGLAAQLWHKTVEWVAAPPGRV